jgi:hypothetical protein
MRHLTMLLAVTALLLLGPAVAHAEDWLSVVTPDAGLYAQTIGADSRGVEGVSFVLGQVAGHRGWLDVLKPLDRVGVGVSADLRPGGLLCLGGGYQADTGWLGYVGVHIGW